MTFPWGWGSRITEQLILDGLGSVKHLLTGRLLDLGCGMKPYQRPMGGAVEEWIGLDFAATPSGRSRADVVGSGLAIPFASESFDTVLSTQVLEHVPRPLDLLREAQRVLRAGGHLVLSAPQTNPLHEEPQDFFRYTCYGLRYLSETVGLEVVDLRPLGGAIATVGQLVVWHLGWLRRLPVAGRLVGNACNASISWAALKLDRLSSMYGGGAMKDTINWLLVARKSARC